LWGVTEPGSGDVNWHSAGECQRRGRVAQRMERSFAAVQRNARARQNPPPRYALNDVGGIVDLAEQEVEAAKARGREESLRRQREEREAQRTALAAEHAEHARVERAAPREASRDQFPELA
jgi:hypothetical protein